MEIANLSPRANGVSGSIRVATPADAGAIMRLLQSAPYSHVHVDWSLPGDWLGTPGFVVQPELQPTSRMARLMGLRPCLQACLAAAADPPPAAWVRVASVTDVEHPQVVLAAMLEPVVAYLRRAGVAELGWLVVDEWPAAWLPELGFVLVNHIETYQKDDMSQPDFTALPGLHIRPVAAGDMDALAHLEAAAFAPLWRHSAHGLTLAWHGALTFDVAVLRQKIVGFQLSSHSNSGAHLVRMTVAPEWQRCGIGSALLAHAIQGYRRRGLAHVSLNTQVDNLASQYLYRKFGFYATGHRLPVWLMPLSKNDG
jgi:ribosomal-protein-alanine N-acetyltransferase